MFKEMKRQLLIIKQKKYDLVLNFLNKVFNTKNTSLCLFRDMDIDKINELRFIEILNDDKDELEVELNIRIDEYKMKPIDIISMCVRSIEYNVIRRNITVCKQNKQEKKKLLISIFNGI
jgi:hypothetical protein